MSLSDKRLSRLRANVVGLDRLRHDARNQVSERIHGDQKKWGEIAAPNRKRNESDWGTIGANWSVLAMAMQQSSVVEWTMLLPLIQRVMVLPRRHT